MSKFRKNLFLGIVIIVSSITGFFLERNEQRSYILETESWAGTTPTYLPNNTAVATEVAQGYAEAMRRPDKVNINNASLRRLQKLPGIGKKRAKQIIKYRQQNKFEVIEDIMKVPGIGTELFEGLKDKITV